MQSIHGFEIGRFRLKAGATEEALKVASMAMETRHLYAQAGFVAHYVVRLDDGLYLDLVFANSRADAERICNSWRGQVDCEAFLALIEPESMSSAR